MNMCPLTPAQIDVVQRLTDGTARKLIAADMGISVVTIYNHLKNARSRTGADNDFALVAEAVRQGWVS